MTKLIVLGLLAISLGACASSTTVYDPDKKPHTLTGTVLTPGNPPVTVNTN